MVGALPTILKGGMRSRCGNCVYHREGNAIGIVGAPVVLWMQMGARGQATDMASRANFSQGYIGIFQVYCIGPLQAGKSIELTVARLWPKSTKGGREAQKAHLYDAEAPESRVNIHRYKHVLTFRGQPLMLLGECDLPSRSAIFTTAGLVGGS